jgi:dolichol-phosphate mannosyltransferase
LARPSLPYLSLVIPTRNEAASVEPLVAAICRAMPGPSKELVFVDDSDDDTPKVLQRILREADCPGLVMQRTRSHRDGGLSTAVVRGFMVSGGAYICTMDADLQHPASAVPLLLDAAVEKRADIVVGSRYLTRHSRVDGFETAGRRFVSSTATYVASRLLPQARATTDPLSGFFMLRRSVIDGVELRPRGYKILLEILVRGHWRRVADVPYSFHSRNAGVSKATMREGMQFVQHLVMLKRRNGRQVAPRPDRERAANGIPSWLSATQNPTTRSQEHTNGVVEAGIGDRLSG